MKIIRNVISLILCIAFLISSVPNFSAIAEEGGFNYKKGANAISDSYKISPFYRKLNSVTLTGDGRQDVLAVAISQLGYQESGQANDFDGFPSGTSSNFTEYNYNMGDFGVGYGGGSYAWCASFVAWCLLQAECTDHNKMSDWCRYHYGDKNYIWREVGCPGWARQLRECGYWQESRQYGGQYVPIGGDLIFFTWDGTKYSEDHIGFVVYCDGTTVYTIEGNTADAAGLETNGGGVYFKSYPINSGYIAGYGVLPYKTADCPKNDYSGETVNGGYYIANDGLIIYESAEGTERVGRMPRFTQFRVLQIAESGRAKITCTVSTKEVTGFVNLQKNSALPFVYGGLISTGDVNGDGFIDIEDYILIKRFCLDNAKLNEEQQTASDVNSDGVVNVFDYILVKRHCMGTYDLGNK